MLTISNSQGKGYDFTDEKAAIKMLLSLQKEGFCHIAMTLPYEVNIEPSNSRRTATMTFDNLRLNLPSRVEDANNNTILTFLYFSKPPYIAVQALDPGYADRGLCWIYPGTPGRLVFVLHLSAISPEKVISLLQLARSNTEKIIQENLEMAV
jgi:hypothetical protein